MKKQILLVTVFFACSINFLFAQSEQKTKNPEWVSDKGFWVVENNIHSPKCNTLYFYTLDQVLVYKEQVNGVKIKLNKKKVLLRLRKILEQSVAAWEAQHIARENENVVAVALKNE